MFDGLPYSVYLLAKATIEEFSNINKNVTSSLSELFDNALQNMNNIIIGNNQFLDNKNKRDVYFKKLDFGFSLFKKGYENITSNKFILIDNQIFDDNEIQIIKNEYECKQFIFNSSLWSEISEQLSLFVNELRKIKEIDEIFKKEFKIKKGRIVYNSNIF